MFFTVFSLCLGANILTYSLFVPSLKISHGLGAIDLPNERKIHAKPVARAGGSAFFVSFILFLFLLPIDRSYKIALFLSSCAIFMIGIIDDCISISPIIKLMGQILSAGIYIVLGEKSETPLNVSISLLWIVFITNAINLCDGLDGLACTISSEQALCLSVLALIFQSTDVLLCSLLLFGATIGFLPHNFPNAKIFMGDCGALFLGFMLGCLSSRLAFESQSIICVISILFIFRIPILDTAQSFIRRIIAKRNPFAADRGHFHHRLLHFGFTKACTTLLILTISLIFGFIGVMIAFLTMQ